MAVMKPNNPFDMLASVSSSPSVAVSPYDYSANTNITMTTQHQQNIEYFMSHASPNLLTIQETISNDVLADIGEDSMKKRIKQDVARKLAEEIVSTKVTFTSQENYAEHTRIIRAKTYVFTADELKAFIEKCIK